ncbi:hypothetical protein SAMN05880590_10682 [Rhizobium sp. RU35A]|uniref:Uncharacterized protein n=1 Tax=Rhizobium straminoryzae TaxID=1387186 RepID=A0A549SZQ5_9HYPH|nr:MULTISPECIES: hypothetical protein [Rhizobium]TRL35110.1 hypothetical protein FNA46_20770 [Rhizobium straminoryzae]SIQ65943.1 hypothetical protein SAMN05880590_10682 [Rhizobium sp. RU35A]
MTIDSMDAIGLRNLVATCDRQDALSIPKSLSAYVTDMLDARQPSVYLVDLLPSLSTAMQAFLTAIGAFNLSPLPEPEVTSRRNRLLECLDTFIDEARLCQQSVVFMDTISAAAHR